MGRMSGKVCVVTGAGRGIGAAAAAMLADEGAHVVLTDIRKDEVETMAATIRDQGGQALALIHEVTSEERWAFVVAETVARFGRLDVLVNNAGVGKPKAMTETTLAEFRQIMAINCDGVFMGMKAAIPVMTKGGGGSIVNISSILGKVGGAYNIAYCGSKGAVLMMTKAAALELAPLGIRVNSIHPGFIETPMLNEGLRSGPDGEANVAAATRLHPIGRLGSSEEIAEGILFLASDASRFMTGSEVVIDGGYTAI